MDPAAAETRKWHAQYNPTTQEISRTISGNAPSTFKPEKSPDHISITNKRSPSHIPQPLATQ